MTQDLVRVGDILRLRREPIELSPTDHYSAIGMRSYGKGIFHYPPAPPAALSKLRYYRFPANALALSNIKAWEGAIAVTSEADSGTVASNRFLFYVPIDETCVDVNYVRYYLLSEGGLSAIGSASPGSADRNRTLSIAGFERMKVPLPPIAEQRRIARELDHVMGVVSSDRSEVLASAVRDSLLRTMFPTSGARDAIGELLELARSPIEIDVDKSYRSIGIRSFGKGMIYYPESKGSDLSKLRYYRFPPNALAVSNIKAWEGAISLSPESTDQFIASNRFLFYLPKRRTVDVRYLSYYLISSAGLAQVGRASPGSADRNRTLSIERFDEVVVPVPSIEEQRRVVSVLDRAFGDLVSLDERRNRLRQALRHSALNAAFSGAL